VVISCPSACTASIVQDFTGLPSTSTVQAPQFVVSQPMCVPVSPSPRRIRCDSSSRGSTSATVRTPLTEIVIRRIGTCAASCASSRMIVMSGRTFRIPLASREPLDDRHVRPPCFGGSVGTLGAPR
jgi:hypothetical protein